MVEITRKKSNVGLGIILWALLASSLWATWEIQTVDSVGNVGLGSSIALDKNGYPNISYWDATHWYLKYARWNGTSWEIQIVDSMIAVNCAVTGISENTSLAIDNQGYPHISYGSYNSKLKYAQWDGTTWKIQVVDSSTNGVWNSIALDKNGYPHISYSGQGLKYTYWDGFIWHSEVVDTGTVGDNSLAIDSNNNPQISYSRDGKINYAQWDGSYWQIQRVDTSLFYATGEYNSLALDSIGSPHISYTFAKTDLSLLGLRYAWWSGTSWEIQTVENDTSGSGNSNFLVLDAKNYPLLCYYSWIGEVLKYARWNGTTWKIETIDSGIGISRNDISIALDTADYLHVSYYGGNGDLKYARGEAEEIKEKGVSRSLEEENFRIHSNPFSVSTTIEFNIRDLSLKNYSYISLKIYSSTGELVRTLLDERRGSGHQRVEWDGRDQKGSKLPAGFYFCRLMINSSTQTKKVTLMKARRMK